MRPGSEGRGSGFFGDAPARHPDECNALTSASLFRGTPLSQGRMGMPTQHICTYTYIYIYIFSMCFTIVTTIPVNWALTACQYLGQIISPQDPHNGRDGTVNLVGMIPVNWALSARQYSGHCETCWHGAQWGHSPPTCLSLPFAPPVCNGGTLNYPHPTTNFLGR